MRQIRQDKRWMINTHWGDLTPNTTRNIRTKKVKVKWSRYRPGVTQRVGRGIALLFHDRDTRRGEWWAVRPGRTSSPGKSRYPFYRRLRGSQGRSGGMEILVSTGIRSQTVHPVVSRYTDYTHNIRTTRFNIQKVQFVYSR